MTFLNRMELGWWAGSRAAIGLGGVLSMLQLKLYPRHSTSSVSDHHSYK